MYQTSSEDPTYAADLARQYFKGTIVVTISAFSSTDNTPNKSHLSLNCMTGSPSLNALNRLYEQCWVASSRQLPRYSADYSSVSYEIFPISYVSIGEIFE